MRHCGPTAVTNVILTLRAGRPDRAGAARTEKDRAEQERIFHICAKTGMEMLAYWNMDLFGRFGGTSNLLTIPYLRLCLLRTGTRGVRIGPIQKFSPGRAARSLQKGALLYMILHRHPRYGNHHAVVCGGFLSGGLYLLTEDGWSPQMQTIPAGDFRGSWYFEVEYKQDS